MADDAHKVEISMVFWRVVLVVALLAVVLWAELLLIELSHSRPQPMMLPPLYASDSAGATQRPVSGDTNIFFIEPTCIFEEVPWFGLGTLQMCAVESAIRHNSEYHVYVLHTCAPPAEGFTVPDGAKAIYAPTDFFFKDTDLDPSILTLYRFFGTEYSVQHAKEVLSLVTLWKYGGIYLTLDYIIQRPLWGLGEDWITAAGPKEVSLRAMSLSATPLSPGQQVAIEIVRRLHVDGGAPDGAVALVNSVLSERCAFDQTDVSVEDCRGISILPGELLLPVPADLWQNLYMEDLAEDMLSLVHDAYGVCFYHEMNEDLFPSPNSAYGRLGQWNCPSIFFGSTGNDSSKRRR
ncbi:uncharacterized protein LOC124594519 [Schistocerca americana]|uniref:uncharacterized protein LOC124594519 n=1 Tax=Schistocerca americana TaxID=7009 RepID=UPI001F4F1B59|nr:uncharacterized protein LOC124594519 [Schistocerca americana]